MIVLTWWKTEKVEQDRLREMEGDEEEEEEEGEDTGSMMTMTMTTTMTTTTTTTTMMMMMMMTIILMCTSNHLLQLAHHAGVFPRLRAVFQNGVIYEYAKGRHLVPEDHSNPEIIK